MKSTLDFAKSKDEQDPLKNFRDEFLFPTRANGKPLVYMAGNSLGLQPKKVQSYIQQELDDWATFAVEGHLKAKSKWYSYHELLTEPTARLVGAKPSEVVVMNTLSVNLHLLMVSFYRPTTKRFKILIEGTAFPSDQYAVDSQIRFHGFDPKTALIEAQPRAGERTLRTEDLVELIEKQGDEIALVLLGNVNYLTGQAFEVSTLAHAAHKKGCLFGLDLAHGAGNLELKLHDWEVDFATWCSYKYLNGGPGTLSGCFIHERHLGKRDLPRFEGWWGHNKIERFKMERRFDPMPTAEAWQLSNPPIFQMAALRASMELFDKATMPALRKKSVELTGYLEFLIKETLPSQKCQIITPHDPNQRGCQLSLSIKGNPRAISQTLLENGIVADAREPDIMRAAPAPLYCRFQDVYEFAQGLKNAIES